MADVSRIQFDSEKQPHRIKNRTIMKTAVIYGIDGYRRNPLEGCVRDAQKMEKCLSHHFGGDPNFQCRLRHAPNKDNATLSVSVLHQDLRWVFSNKPETLLLYFSGHGVNDDLGTQLLFQDGSGYALRDLVARANNALINRSVTREVIIILDCCLAGDAGNQPVIQDKTAVLAEGLTLLAASRADQPSQATENGSVFTNLLVEALGGGAADLKGSVSLSAAYAYLERRLGAFDQRPVFKCNVSSFSELRRCEKPIAPERLRKLTDYFPDPKHFYPLEPSYEKDKKDAPPDKQECNEKHEAIFADLRKFASLALLEPVDEEYMYWAAVHSTGCRLTSLGRHYWQLIKRNYI
ncbi:MAG: caspase family protein [Gammaproteobacteria bacterium]